MNVKLNCSELLRDKLEKALSSSSIDVCEDAKIELVEQGRPVANDKIGIVFNPIDYVEVLDLLNGVNETESGKIEGITGFYNNRYTILNLKDISYFESEGARVICVSGSVRYSVKETLNYYENQLKEAGFFRANKSQVVNLMKVKEIIPWFNSRLVLSMPNKSEIEVSKLYSKSLRSLLKL